MRCGGLFVVSLNVWSDMPPYDFPIDYHGAIFRFILVIFMIITYCLVYCDLDELMKRAAQAKFNLSVLGQEEQYQSKESDKKCYIQGNVENQKFSSELAKKIERKLLIYNFNIGFFILNQLSHEIFEERPMDQFTDQGEVNREKVLQSFYKGICMFICSFGLLLGCIQIPLAFFYELFAQIALGVFIYYSHCYTFIFFDFLVCAVVLQFFWYAVLYINTKSNRVSFLANKKITRLLEE